MCHLNLESNPPPFPLPLLPFLSFPAFLFFMHASIVTAKKKKIYIHGFIIVANTLQKKEHKRLTNEQKKHRMMASEGGDGLYHKGEDGEEHIGKGKR